MRKQIVKAIEKARDQYKLDFPNADRDMFNYEEPPYDFIQYIQQELECSADMARHLNWVANKDSNRLTFKA